MDETIRGKIRQVFSEVTKVPVEHLHEEVRVREELGIDSLLGLQLLVACERRLGVEVDEEKCAELETVGEFIAYFEAATES